MKTSVTKEVETPIITNESAKRAGNSGWYPVQVGAELYLDEQQGQLAVAEFQKIPDHRGPLWNCATGALAHLGLARAHARQGDTAKANAGYQDFFSSGKTPTPMFPSPSLRKRNTRS
jgi:hypothetical protein